MDDQELRDPEYWKARHDEFLKLDPNDRLTLDWTYFPDSQGYWFLIRRFSDEYEYIEARFSVLIARVGRIANSANPTDGWLRQIVKRSIGRGSRCQMINPSTGKLATCLTGTTDKICELSAILCSRYEKRMVDEKSRENASASITHIPEQTPPHTPSPSLGDRMNAAADELGIKHDALARRMRIGKTSYFAVKRGEGGRSSKAKVRLYLDKHHKIN